MAILDTLIPDLYDALNIVSQEMTGYIAAVTRNTKATGAAVNEDIWVPIAGPAVAHDIVPGVTPQQPADPNIGGVTMKITKSRSVPILWNGETYLGYSNNGTMDETMRTQFAEAFRALANEVEADLAGLYKGASRAFGTPGTTPFSSGVSDSAQMRKILMDNGAPLSDLQLVIDTSAGANLRSNTQLTKANEAGTDRGLRFGELLNLNGLSIHESGQIRNHTNGNLTGALVNNSGGYPIGTTVIAYDTGTGMPVAGDVVSFANAGTEKYVVSQSVSVSPMTLGAPGLMKPVADNAAIAPIGTYVPNLAFSRSALQLLARTPAMPAGGDMADDVGLVVHEQTGIAFQVAHYRGYRQVITEIGLAWGVALIKPEHVAILVG